VSMVIMDKTSRDRRQGQEFSLDRILARHRPLGKL